MLESGEPWTRYRALVDLLGLPEDDSQVQAARAEMLSDPHIQALVRDFSAWPGPAITRHNDAAHPIHKLALLADFGLRASDPGMAVGVAAVLSHQSPEGAFQSLVSIPRAFGGTGEPAWVWMSCDAPVLLAALLALGLGDDPRVQAAVSHLAGLVEENGWRCKACPQVGKFRGPGRKMDPCPIANVYALKALAASRGTPADFSESPAARAGIAMLLNHWQEWESSRPYLFGIGSTFHKLKYPFVWYDILHVADVLSRFPLARADDRFQQMAADIAAQADEFGRFTAGSAYLDWKGWSFADKKSPSPWLTLLSWRVRKRAEMAGIY